MKKRTLIVVLLVLVLSSLVIGAQDEIPSTNNQIPNKDCGSFCQECSERSDRIFCKIGKWWNGFRGKEGVVGKAREK